MFPSSEILNEQIEDKTSIFECPSCNKTFPGNKMEIQEGLPDNMFIAGISQDQKIPKCPYCGNLAFFGFQKIK